MPVISKNSRRNNRPATRGRAHQSGVEGASVSPNPAELELSISSLSSTTETVTSAETITSTETLTPGETIALAETSETSDAADPTGPPRVAPGDESHEEIRALLDAIFQGPPPSSPARNDNHQHQRLPVHAQQPDSLQDHVSLQFLPQVVSAHYSRNRGFHAECFSAFHYQDVFKACSPALRQALDAVCKASTADPIAVKSKRTNRSITSIEQLTLPTS
ncbi:hypothetical protein PF005_g1805 [Phytophthora fragariae]|uniref:Uncharacterized protein n=1 Tax=Phytophthora fragariae TaxID=53985 RepID=A0A6A4ABY7_9STRA|nr:hypothetical protein PF009_g1933 [Phytophthora fragariae]KAE9029347.1 hypothetical protein PF011_g1121 [Phytophthora fragariae]KAE9136993.1 hypothetical protein PF007_g1967 [Phytophthora fragariae]KAE9234644.1 hypothetical protein PF005_g1805 [Phytophthora fragariae]KAE9256506.1 hypothetical protein PF002_g1821 [Phytophthora fragariae]